MKEHPILFSTKMVQAILAGRKTQTRRVVKNLSITLNHYGRFNYASNTKRNPRSGINIYFEQLNDAITGITELCPYGQPGDLLWVRESWRPIAWDSDTSGWWIQYKDDAELNVKRLFDDPDMDMDLEQKCSDIMHLKEVEYDVEMNNGAEGWSSELIEQHMPWRPSIHMPKAAARIWLRITDVRIELLQDISWNDALSEGICPERMKSPIAIFQHLWEDINGRLSWKSNPWVWVVKFEVVSTNGMPK